MTHTSYALWGRGDVTPQNAAALLEDFMSGPTGVIFRPAGDVPRGGLRTAINWVEDPKQWGDGGTVESEDLIGDLLSEQDGQGDELALVVLLPADPTPDEVAFVKSAASSGIPVFNLSAALDLVDAELLTPVVPEPVKKTRGRKLSDKKDELPFESVTTHATEGPLAEAFNVGATEAGSTVVVQTEPLDPEGPIQLDIIRADDPAAIAAQVSDTLLVTPSEPRQGDAYVNFLAEGALVDALRSIIQHEVYRILNQEGVLNVRAERNEIDMLRNEVEILRDAEKAKRKADKPQVMGRDYDDPKVVDHVVAQMMKQLDDPPFDGPYTGDLTDYYMTPDGQYQLASKGLPRRGWILAPLSEDQVAELRTAGRIL